MIILNSPHNPSGQVLGADDLTQLARLTYNTDIVILSDEVYEHVVFDGQRHHSMATHNELASRSVIVSSFGKTFHVTGWRVGYCLAPAALMDEILKIHQFMMFSADTPMQYAFAEYMADPATYLSLGTFYQHKRDLLVSALQNGLFELLPAAGSFFMLASFANFSDESDSDMVKRLIKDQNLAYEDLAAGRLDGTLVMAAAGQSGFLDKPEGKGFGFIGKAVDDATILGSGIGFGLRKSDTALKVALDKAIKQVQDDGTVEKLAKKYFPGFDVRVQ